MSRYILFSLVLALVYIPNSIAWNIPYGVQDPMGSGKFVNCSGGEMGYWNIVEQWSSDRTRKSIFMVITTVDLADPAFVICIVPPDRKVLVMEPGKKL